MGRQRGCLQHKTVTGRGGSKAQQRKRKSLPAVTVVLAASLTVMVMGNGMVPLLT